MTKDEKNNPPSGSAKSAVALTAMTPAEYEKIPLEIRKFIQFSITQAFGNVQNVLEARLAKTKDDDEAVKAELRQELNAYKEYLREHPYEAIFNNLLSEKELGAAVEKGVWQYVFSTADKLQSTAGHTIDFFKEEAEKQLKSTARTYLEKGFLGEFFTKLGIEYKKVIWGTVIVSAVAVIASGASLWSWYNLRTTEVGKLNEEITAYKTKVEALDSLLKRYETAFGVKSPEELKVKMQAYETKSQRETAVNSQFNDYLAKAQADINNVKKEANDSARAYTDSAVSGINADIAAVKSLAQSAQTDAKSANEKSNSAVNANQSTLVFAKSLESRLNNLESVAQGLTANYVQKQEYISNLEAIRQDILKGPEGYAQVQIRIEELEKKMESALAPASENQPNI